MRGEKQHKSRYSTSESLVAATLRGQHSLANNRPRRARAVANGQVSDSSPCWSRPIKWAPINQTNGHAPLPAQSNCQARPSTNEKRRPKALASKSNNNKNVLRRHMTTGLNFCLALCTFLVIITTTTTKTTLTIKETLQQEAKSAPQAAASPLQDGRRHKLAGRQHDDEGLARARLAGALSPRSSQVAKLQEGATQINKSARVAHDSEATAARPPVSPSPQSPPRSTSEYVSHGTLSGLLPAKIDRMRRHADGPSDEHHQAPTCNDCLALPMVALVGGKQVNGFIIQQPSEAAAAAATSQNGHYGQQFSRVRTGDNYNHNDDNNETPQNQQQQQQQQQQEALTPVLSVDNYQPARYDTPPRPHYVAPPQTRITYESPPPPPPRPFEPISDPECPMTGLLTVCDRIASYPADAILHRLASAQKALEESYFNIDSLFSDESDGLSEPFDMSRLLLPLPPTSKLEPKLLRTTTSSPLPIEQQETQPPLPAPPRPAFKRQQKSFNQTQAHNNSKPSGYYQAVPPTKSSSSSSVDQYDDLVAQTAIAPDEAPPSQQPEVFSGDSWSSSPSSNTDTSYHPVASAASGRAAGLEPPISGASLIASSCQEKRAYESQVVVSRPNSDSLASLAVRRQQALESGGHLGPIGPRHLGLVESTMSSSSHTGHLQNQKQKRRLVVTSRSLTLSNEFLYLVERKGLSISTADTNTLHAGPRRNVRPRRQIKADGGASGTYSPGDDQLDQLDQLDKLDQLHEHTTAPEAGAHEGGHNHNEVARAETSASQDNVASASLSAESLVKSGAHRSSDEQGHRSGMTTTNFHSSGNTKSAYERPLKSTAVAVATNDGNVRPSSSRIGRSLISNITTTTIAKNSTLKWGRARLHGAYEGSGKRAQTELLPQRHLKQLKQQAPAAAGGLAHDELENQLDLASDNTNAEALSWPSARGWPASPNNLAAPHGQKGGSTKTMGDIHVVESPSSDDAGAGQQGQNSLSAVSSRRVQAVLDNKSRRQEIGLSPPAAAKPLPLNGRDDLAGNGPLGGEFAALEALEPLDAGSASREPALSPANSSSNYNKHKATLERSRRQVPAILVNSNRASSANGGEQPAATRTNNEQLDPERIGSDSAASGASDQATGPQPICRAKSIYISPRAALNDKKQWKYVVNAPERDPRIKQIIRVDICEAPFEPCSGDLTLPLGFASQCKQKYAKKKLLALDSRSGLLEVDTFFIPSCCVCQLIPDMRPFGTPASGTPPVEENMSPLVEGTDNERPQQSPPPPPPPPAPSDTESSNGRAEDTEGRPSEKDNNGEASEAQ